MHGHLNVESDLKIILLPNVPGGAEATRRMTLAPTYIF